MCTTENNTYRWYRHEEGKNSISHNNVKAIYYDRTNEIMWIGTHLGGLNKLDLRTNRFTVYRMKARRSTSLPSDIVRDIVPYKDKLVVATQNGVCLFNPATGACQQLFKETKEGRGIGMVASLYIDKDGTLWIAATGRVFILIGSTAVNLLIIHTIPLIRTALATIISTVSCRTVMVIYGSAPPKWSRPLPQGK